MSATLTAAPLIEARARAWEEAKATLDAAESEKRELTAEESQKWDAIMADLDVKDARIAQIVAAEERAAAADEARARFEAIVRPTEDAPEARDGEPADVAEFRALLAGERPQGIELRALSKGTATAGGNTVPTGMADTIEALTRDNSVAFRMGARVFSVDSLADFAAPVATGNGAATSPSEGSQITGTDPAVGQVVLKPARKFAEVVLVSYELEHSSVANVIQWVSELAAENTAVAFDAKAVAGTGTAEAQGIFVGYSAAVTAASGSITMDNLIDLQYSIVDRDRSLGVWVMKDSTAAACRKLREGAGTGAYLWQPSLQAGQPDLLLGRPVYTDPNSPAIGTGLKSVAFFRPTSYGIASYNAVRVDIDRSFAFDTDRVAIRVVQHVDGAVLQPASGKLLVHA